MNYVRHAIALMPGYTLGEQPQPGIAFIKLNTNQVEIVTNIKFHIVAN